MEEQMRRAAQALPAQKAFLLLEEGKEGVLSLCNDNIPYGVPMNYILKNRTLYFHCAAQGKKMRMLEYNPQVCFTVVVTDEVVPEKFTTAYQSVVVSGSIEKIECRKEKVEILYQLCKKYCPGVSEDQIYQKVEQGADATAVLVLPIRHISAKQGKELL